MKKIKIFIALYYIFFILFGVTLTYAQTAQEIAKKTFRSTVLLVMEDANGQPLSLGSGFFVRNGEIATNLHVVEGAAGGYAKLMDEKTKYDIEGVTAVDTKRDLVILKISNVRSQALSIGNSDAVQVGEPIFVVGNPKGLEGTFSQGIISSIRTIGSDKILQITAPISPGSSGGPVLNKKGKVIGVSVATFKGGQNLNFAIPASYLKTLLSKTGIVKPLAKSKQGKNQRSILSNIGGSSTEGIIGESFVWDNNYDNSYIRNQGFTFSIRNHLRSAVSNILVLIIFYDRSGLPLDVIPLKFSNLIPPKLAKRVSSSADYSIKKMTTSYKGVSKFKDSPDTKIEFRILDFKIVE
ncbi:MAG: serine protease [Deltaproteobacteria bacterium]|nr:serine protease [Deltaproteobacteria bacterium]